MKTIVVYTSQTGFTKKYAEWIAQRLNAETLTLDEAKNASEDKFADAEAILYGGWIMAGKVKGSEWFTDQIIQWQGKKLALFCVGGCPNDAPDIERELKEALTDEQRKYAKAFYCQGGICFEKMKFVSRFFMKMFAKTLKKKAVTEADKAMAEMISKSYDISDKKYIEPVVEYIEE